MQRPPTPRKELTSRREAPPPIPATAMSVPCWRNASRNAVVRTSVTAQPRQCALRRRTRRRDLGSDNRRLVSCLPRTPLSAGHHAQSAVAIVTAPVVAADERFPATAAAASAAPRTRGSGGERGSRRRHFDECKARRRSPTATRHTHVNNATPLRFTATTSAPDAAAAAACSSDSCLNRTPQPLMLADTRCLHIQHAVTVIAARTADHKAELLQRAAAASATCLRSRASGHGFARIRVPSPGASTVRENRITSAISATVARSATILARPPANRTPPRARARKVMYARTHSKKVNALVEARNLCRLDPPVRAHPRLEVAVTPNIAGAQIELHLLEDAGGPRHD